MSADDFKTQAHRLGDHLGAVHGVKLKHNSLLRAIAAIHGAASWTALTASAPRGMFGRIREAFGPRGPEPASDACGPDSLGAARTIGHASGTRQPLLLAERALTLHMLLCGTNGFAAHTCLDALSLMYQERGGDVLVLDDKDDVDFQHFLTHVSCPADEGAHRWFQPSEAIHVRHKGLADTSALRELLLTGMYALKRVRGAGAAPLLVCMGLELAARLPIASLLARARSAGLSIAIIAPDAARLDALPQGTREVLASNTYAKFFFEAEGAFLAALQANARTEPLMSNLESQVERPAPALGPLGLGEFILVQGCEPPVVAKLDAEPVVNS